MLRAPSSVHLPDLRAAFCARAAATAQTTRVRSLTPSLLPLCPSLAASHTRLLQARLSPRLSPNTRGCDEFGLHVDPSSSSFPPRFDANSRHHGVDGESRGLLMRRRERVRRGARFRPRRLLRCRMREHRAPNRGHKKSQAAWSARRKARLSCAQTTNARLQRALTTLTYTPRPALDTALNSHLPPPNTTLPTRRSTHG